MAEEQIKKNQKFILFGGFGLFMALLLFGLWVSDPNAGKLTSRELAKLEAQEVKEDYQARSVLAITPEERWISKSEKELSDYKIKNKQLEGEQRTLREQLDSLTERVSELSKNKPSVSESSFVNGKLPPPAAVPARNEIPVLPPGTSSQNVKNTVTNKVLPATPLARNAVNTGSDGKPINAIQVFSFEDKNNTSKKKKKSMNISHYLPSGAFGKIVLLSGVDAPTGGEADSNPVPILMRLIDHGTLPNYFNSEIRDCHVTGAVRGDLSSERAKIRTERLSCILINGDVVEVKIKGWINGEDGKEGFRGRVVEKAGALLARTFFAGLFSGIGTSVADQYKDISVSPLGSVTSLDADQSLKSGLATGASGSLDALADYYMERANEIYPIIEIAANRIGELVLQEGVDLERNIIGNMGVDK